MSEPVPVAMVLAWIITISWIAATWPSIIFRDDD